MCENSKSIRLDESKENLEKHSLYKAVSLMEFSDKKKKKIQMTADC